MSRCVVIVVVSWGDYTTRERLLSTVFFATVRIMGLIKDNLLDFRRGTRGRQATRGPKGEKGDKGDDGTASMPPTSAILTVLDQVLTDGDDVLVGSDGRILWS